MLNNRNYPSAFLLCVLEKQVVNIPLAPTYLFGVFSECEDVRCFHFIQMPWQWVEFVENECSSGWNLLYTIVFLYKKINQLMHTEMVSGTHHPLVCYFYLVAIL